MDDEDDEDDERDEYDDRDLYDADDSGREFQKMYAILHAAIDIIHAMWYNGVIGGKRRNKRERRRDGE